MRNTSPDPEYYALMAKQFVHEFVDVATEGKAAGEVSDLQLDDFCTARSLYADLLQIAVQDYMTSEEYKNREYKIYLDDLRESGVTNMFGAGSYLQEEFGLSKSDARTALQYWMKNFGK